MSCPFQSLNQMLYLFGDMSVCFMFISFGKYNLCFPVRGFWVILQRDADCGPQIEATRRMPSVRCVHQRQIHLCQISVRRCVLCYFHAAPVSMFFPRQFFLNAARTAACSIRDVPRFLRSRGMRRSKRRNGIISECSRIHTVSLQDTPLPEPQPAEYLSG